MLSAKWQRKQKHGRSKNEKSRGSLRIKLYCLRTLQWIKKPHSTRYAPNSSDWDSETLSRFASETWRAPFCPLASSFAPFSLLVSPETFCCSQIVFDSQVSKTASLSFCFSLCSTKSQHFKLCIYLLIWNYKWLRNYIQSLDELFWKSNNNLVEGEKLPNWSGNGRIRIFLPRLPTFHQQPVSGCR